MSNTPSPSIQNLDNLCQELALMCSASTPIELFERLTKTLHAYTQGQPIALYRRLMTGDLRLAYCYPLENTLACHNDLLTVSCYEDLADAALHLYELTGERGVWGYIGHPQACYAGPSQWAQLLVDIASQRLRLLKAEHIATRQTGLKSRRKLLSRDSKRLTSINDILQHHGAGWCDIFKADGIVLAYQGNLHCFGQHPPKHPLLRQLQHLYPQTAHNEIVELNGRCQGILAAQLSLANTHLGWLLLYRQQPLISAPSTESAVQDALSYWMPAEASMVIELADDVAVAITAQEVVHLSLHLTQTNQQLGGLAHTDPLTKCWNRYYTELVIEDLSQSTTPFTLLMFDIDDFTQINNAHGHAVGDGILHDITQLVQITLLDDDHLGRWEGEAFIVIAKELSQHASLKLANRLSSVVEKHPFAIAEQVTISVGLTLAKPGELTHQLLERLGQGMNLAKSAGKNQVFSC